MLAVSDAGDYPLVCSYLSLCGAELLRVMCPRKTGQTLANKPMSSLFGQLLVPLRFLASLIIAKTDFIIESFRGQNTMPQKKGGGR